jgi:conjugal transfer pilus assembly protein TraW
MKQTPLRFALIASLCAVALSGGVRANDLGTVGQTFKILEFDLLKDMSGKLHKAEKTGEINKWNAEFAARAQKRIENPPAVVGVHTTTTARTWLYDPSIIAPQDYADQQGRVFVHAGEKVNPLQRMPSYNKVMVFFDGTDPRQVKAAMALYRKYGAERTKLILTNGSPIDVDKKQQVIVYYDQAGKLTSKFGIRQVPATVIRENDVLRISEIQP